MSARFSHTPLQVAHNFRCVKYRNFVGNMAKGRILKWVFQKKQSTLNFPKNEHFSPSDTHTYRCVSGDKKCFSENLACFLFFWNTRSKIRPFAILPTISPDFSQSPEIVRKLRLSAKFSHLEIRRNYGILPSVYVFIPNMETFGLEKTSYSVLFVIYLNYTEVVARRCLVNRCSMKTYKIDKKHLCRSFFNIALGLRHAAY